MSEAEAAPRVRRAGRGRAVLLLVVGAALTAASTVPVWVRATGTSALLGDVPVTMSGSRVAPGVVAAGIVLLAAAAAAGLVGRVGRWVVAGVVVVAGAVAIAAVLGVLRDPAAAAVSVVAAQTGVGVLTGPAHLTAWPWLALVAGAADAGIGCWIAVASAGWSGPSARHVPAGAAGAAVVPGDDRSAWDALSRGDDPTDG